MKASHSIVCACGGELFSGLSVSALATSFANRIARSRSVFARMRWVSDSTRAIAAQLMRSASSARAAAVSPSLRYHPCADNAPGSGSDRRARDDRADARHAHQTLTAGVLAGHSLDLS